ncbi:MULTISPECIES: diaminobutyrate acetyltransferase [Henriciella]|jgi:L-2,4-diaminobutyric acid acetyltransferase|uniref:L-2,4-diaminobutyric acid acetyltransferase n=1 Tax=Henriciella pelagia TaxID=1977912 RepID=A0ABQ1JJG2_9PROT|nr:diaminobutyrate acetyltransferase [Henriciella pelagia]GGB68313.1 L-2,4-diaminobutyric acid acetyltransferase [Henriciella pelagia]
MSTDTVEISGAAQQSSAAHIEISAPRSEDGAAVHDLVAACPPLDTNSLYMNLIQTTHFAQTCALARADGEVVAWVSGHIPPEEPDVYFLWQVAVGEKARGQRIAKRLVADIFSRPACSSVKYLKTTITPDNEASWGLFRSIARWLDAPLKEGAFFDKDRHFKGRHDSEILVTIGPFELPAGT